ncbi:MAG: hypothetical protein U9N14_01415, partial [Pseudomonadota bacterium]|nr:hypothetical protein [Pseudomonadota bacterium]
MSEEEDRATPILQPGHTDRLGAHLDSSGQGTHFALNSEHATRVELCVFDDAGRETRFTLNCETVTWNGHKQKIWHGFHPDLKQGAMYGYRVHGPYDPKNGHRFNPN